ncbi:peptide chain release factor N(5)-glutamine methyltransferase [Nakamurella deserti]|uniref:peptide chain release factor N(5)-glutamine methyltransferase n=1 Tax=Nakamurella deserti TaxID=2164074 RepID=UPI000DBEAADA|nr:peptide chain release factor N(5)-glutamine methyltransferase [Nakamurella deserti]
MSRESLRVAIMEATKKLAEAGVGSPQVDAELLAAHLLAVDRTRLGMTPLVEHSWVADYQAAVDRRAQRIPLQHITGQAYLGAATVLVGPGVFTPRPETEVLLEWALDAISTVKNPLVVDLCSGSGAIAIAVSLARPDATVIAVEADAGALSWARRNIDRHQRHGGTPITLRGGDIFDERLLSDLDGKVDLVTANPPYVPEGTPVEPEVSHHDPGVAVFAGADGLSVIKPMISVAAGLLKPGGSLAFEHDDTQGSSVPALLAARRVLAGVEDHVDLNGRPRFASARRVALQH